VSCKDTPEALDERVRGIAEVLWESAGRPEGTADEDWHLAEQIVQRATAAA
jgi:phosphosulfolactate phosphohydrolase-like enzyme